MSLPGGPSRTRSCSGWVLLRSDLAGVTGFEPATPGLEGWQSSGWFFGRKPGREDRYCNGSQSTQGQHVEFLYQIGPALDYL